MNLLFTSHLHCYNERIPELAGLSKLGILSGEWILNETPLVIAINKLEDMSVIGYIVQRCKYVSAVSDGAPWFPGALGRIPRLLVKSAPQGRMNAIDDRKATEKQCCRMGSSIQEA